MTDLELVDEGVDRNKELIAACLKAVRRSTSSLSSLLLCSRDYAGYLSVTQPESDELCMSLRLGAKAGATIFALAMGESEVEVLLSEAPVVLPSTGPTDATHVANWRIGWWLAHIVRDQVSINLLTQTSLNVLRQSSTKGDECHYLFVDALRAFQERDSDWHKKLLVAIDATDPSVFSLVAEEFVLNIIVPEMEMLLRLALGENARFNESLEYALVRHKKYWSKSRRKQDPVGFLALGPLAFASLAFDAGMSIEVESEYLPKWLYEGKCRG